MLQIYDTAKTYTTLLIQCTSEMKRVIENDDKLETSKILMNDSNRIDKNVSMSVHANTYATP